LTKAPKDKLRLLNPDTYVAPFLTNSFLSVACTLLGDTEDKWDN